MKHLKKFRYLQSFLVLPLLLFNGPCTTVANDTDAKLTDFQFLLGTPGQGNAPAKAALLETIREAKIEIVAAFNNLADVEIEAALIAAINRGIPVHIAVHQPNLSAFSAFQDPDLIARNRVNIKSTAELLDETETELYSTAPIIQHNRQNRTALYNASGMEGQMESNFLVADSKRCWLSTTPPATARLFGVGGEFSIVFDFTGSHICQDMNMEGRLMAVGGVFSDEGVPEFGDFRSNKGFTDPNQRFTINGYVFTILYGSQEQPYNAYFTRLMNARKSIRFASRAIVQDILFNAKTHTANRGHFLDIISYKKNIPGFSLRGIVSNELAQNNCPTLDGSIGNSVIGPMSLHCDLATVMGSDFRKFNGSLPFTFAILDEGSDFPRIIVSSTDFRRRYYNDTGNDIYVEENTDYFYITDSVTLMIEPLGPFSSNKLFAEFGRLYDAIYAQGVVP